MKSKKLPTKAQADFPPPVGWPLSDEALRKALIEQSEVILPLKDLMMMFVGIITPWVRKVNQMEREMEDLKAVDLMLCAEVRKLKKRRH